MSKNSGKAVFGTLLLGGAAAAIYYSLQKKTEDKGNVPTSPGVITIEEVTTTVEYPTEETLPPQTKSTDTPSVRKASGVKVDSFGKGGEIRFKGEKNSYIDLLRYQTSIEVGPVLRDGGPKPLNYVYGNDITIENIVPRLGLATDLNDDEDLRSLGTILAASDGVAKTRIGNISAISKTLGAAELSDISKNTKERLAILCRRVVEGVHDYWKWRANYLKKTDNRFSIYVLGPKNEPVIDRNGNKVKKSDVDIQKVTANIKKLYQLTDLDKQRIASNVLWAVHQLRNPKQTDVNTLDACIDFIVDYNSEEKIPYAKADVSVVCSDPYFRDIVDAFYQGCFNCEVPGAEVVYWAKENKKDRDLQLARRENLSWLSGAIFHGFEKRST